VQGDLFNEGLTLMLAGMGTVFVFLTALVIAMTVMSGLIRRFQPVSVTASDDDEVVAAIAAAIDQHRRK
jgi:oxaloacetate decarboxylase gamma subunit